MKHRWLLFLALLTNFTALSAVADEGFFAFPGHNDLPYKIPGWSETLQKATKNPNAIRREPLLKQCNSFGISSSPKGYRLTAMHCVADCMEKSGELKYFNSKGLKIGMRITEYVHSNCGNYSVVWTGKYFVFWGDSPDGLRKIDLTEEEWTEAASDDFAILSEPYGTPSCLKAERTGMISPTERAYFVGYPSPYFKNTRTNGKNATSEKQVTTGHIYERIGDTPNLYPNLLSHPRPEDPRYLDAFKLMDRSSLIITSIDGAPGMSGSPLLNSKGEVLGVVAGVNLSSLRNGHQYVTSSFAVPITKIFKSFEKRFGESAAYDLRDYCFEY